MFLSGKVEFPPVTIKLHWPDRWSPCCQTEVEVLPLELYQCISCGKVSLGRTQYLEGTVRPLQTSQPAHQ